MSVVAPLRRVARLVSDRADDDAEFKVGLEHIESGTGRLIESAADFEGAGIAFQPGDVLYGKLRPYLAKAWVADRHGAAVGDFLVLRPESDVEARFIRDVLLDRAAVDWITASVFGSKMPRTNWETIGQLPLRKIPPHEQVKVAERLDRETAEIDAFIADQEELVTLLTERRAATIMNVIRDRPYPGDRLSRHARIGNGSTPSRERIDYWQDGDVPWLNSSVVNLDVVSAPSELISALALRECHLPVVPAGSLLVGLTGQGKTRGRVTRLAIDSTINQHLAYVTTDTTLEAGYAYWALTSLYPELRLISDGNGGTKGGLTCEALGATRLPVPPIEKQREITAHLDRETSEIDAAIADAREAIALSKERRAALISAAVTGKLDLGA